MDAERAPDLVISALTTESDPRFEAFYSIYAASIPSREQKPRAQLVALVASSSYKVWLAEQPAQPGAPAQTLGLSVVFAPPEGGFCLLEYLAVHSAHRARSVGGKLFAHSAERALAGRPGVPLIIEVDAEGPTDPEQELRRRRQRFYQRLGCRRLLDCPYILPLPGQGEPPAMDLWAYFAEPPPTVRREALAGWLRGIYHHVYQRSPDDPRVVEMLRQMLEHVPDPVRFS
jgi:GNAT superfamily N-acetyltransferase